MRATCPQGYQQQVWGREYARLTALRCMPSDFLVLTLVTFIAGGGKRSDISLWVVCNDVMALCSRGVEAWVA